MSSASAAGSSAAGAFWKATGRRKRPIAVIPTDVVAAFELAGYGPPCTIAQHTDTPVEKPSKTIRPAWATHWGSTPCTHSASASSLWIEIASWPPSELSASTSSSRSE